MSRRDELAEALQQAAEGFTGLDRAECLILADAALVRLQQAAELDASETLAAWGCTPVHEFDKMSEHKERHYDARRAKRWLDRQRSAA